MARPPGPGPPAGRRARGGACPRRRARRDCPGLGSQPAAGPRAASTGADPRRRGRDSAAARVGGGRPRFPGRLELALSLVELGAAERPRQPAGRGPRTAGRGPGAGPPVRCPCPARAGAGRTARRRRPARRPPPAAATPSPQRAAHRRPGRRRRADNRQIAQRLFITQKPSRPISLTPSASCRSTPQPRSRGPRPPTGRGRTVRIRQA